MRRERSAPRPDFGAKAEKCGFSILLGDGAPYWVEDARYAFTLDEVEGVYEAPSRELHALCMEACARAVGDERTMARLGLTGRLAEMAATSWKAGDPSLYGRFDLARGPDGHAKMLEYNADTPTSIYEAAVFQWDWLEDLKAAGTLPSSSDQYNSIHDRVVAAWKGVSRGRRVHFAAMDEPEDVGTVEYLRHAAMEAGVATVPTMGMRDVVQAKGPDGVRFEDPLRREVDVLFALYPKEWLAADPFGASPAMAGTRFVEPLWKAMPSSKGILALLWEMEPGHPNLLPARFEGEDGGPDVGGSHVRKPLFSREGQGVHVVVDGATVEANAAGGASVGPGVVQAYVPLPVLDGCRSVVGSWVVAGEPCGIGMREDEAYVTGNRSRFVPHYVAS